MAAHRDVLGFLAWPSDTGTRVKPSRSRLISTTLPRKSSWRGVMPARASLRRLALTRSRSSWFEHVMVHKVLQHVGWGGAAAFGIDRVDGKTGSFEHVARLGVDTELRARLWLSSFMSSGAC